MILAAGAFVKFSINKTNDIISIKIERFYY